ncbi:hypothetical protein [Nocardia asteroides]|uniref:hypothetical protein n=1 Tax=Nocardia asteroides TaxID=1824 RepID=UPI0033C26EE3
MTTTISVRARREVTGITPTRARGRVRALLHRELLTPADLIAPVLVQPNHRNPESYNHIPTAVQLSELSTLADELWTLGVHAIKLFAFVENKTSAGSAAIAPDNLMVQAIQTVRAAVPGMVISTEVCGCAWTDTGECVVLDDHGRTDLSATYTLMSSMATLHARAGADIIGPAAVLDGSVSEIRRVLDERGFGDVGITPSVIFDSALFTAYKSAMNTEPGRGNRRGFQIDPDRAGLALLQAERWIREGADSALIQPAMTSIDVLTKLRASTHVPLTVFSPLGESQMFATASDAVLLEYLRSLKRAGADLIMTYDSVRAARLLTEEK